MASRQSREHSLHGYSPTERDFRLPAPLFRQLARTVDGVEDRPANLGPPGLLVAGVVAADQVVLADGALDSERVLAHVGGQRAIRTVHVDVEPACVMTASLWAEP